MVAEGEGTARKGHEHAENQRADGVGLEKREDSGSNQRTKTRVGMLKCSKVERVTERITTGTTESNVGGKKGLKRYRKM